MRQTFLLLILLIFTQGCAASGGLLHFHGSGELLELNVDKHLRSKMSYLEASGPDGVFCSGSSYALHRRSPWMLGCAGDEGKLVLACNDGRHLMGRWSAESCSEGQGVGGDQFGNTFVFAYGELLPDVRRKVGVIPGGKQPPFAELGPASQLYTGMFGYDGEGELAVIVQPGGQRGRQANAPRGGAGFFAAPDGRIATAARDMENDDSVSVYLPDEKRSLPARILSINRSDDIAILKINARGGVGSAVRVIVTKRRSP